MIKSINRIGKVHFNTKAKLKNIKIKITIDKGIIVDIPFGIPISEAECFLNRKSDWIKKQKLKLSNKIILSNYSIPSRKQIEKFEKLILNKFDFYSNKHNLIYNKLNFKWMRTRWGSCSLKGSISFNYWAFFLPDELVDYIILHELMHLKIKNHSTFFWLELEKICNECNFLNKKLNNTYAI